ncbi:MAG: hypothetical protein K2X87_02615 [Gemmataceae bacterium]|nr:hypothetical protein [Gemmataceae bacterium]
MAVPAPDPPEVEQLLADAGAGRREAVGEPIGRHQGLIRQTVEFRMDRRMRARVDPADVAQEAALRVSSGWRTTWPGGRCRSTCGSGGPPRRR